MYRARRSWLPLAVQWGVAGLFVLGALAAQAQTSTSVSGSFSVGGTGSGGYPAGSTCPNGIVGISGPAVATLGSAPSLTLNFSLAYAITPYGLPPPMTGCIASSATGSVVIPLVQSGTTLTGSATTTYTCSSGCAAGSQTFAVTLQINSASSGALESVYGTINYSGQQTSSAWAGPVTFSGSGGVTVFPASPPLQTFSFNVSGSGFSGGGTMTGIGLGSGNYFVNSVSGTLNGQPLSLLPVTSYSYIENFPGSVVNYNYPMFVSSVYLFDDVLYTNGAPSFGGTLLDGGGLGLQTAAAGAINLQSFLFGSGTTLTWGYGLSNAVTGTPTSYPPVSFSVKPVSVPSGSGTPNLGASGTPSNPTGSVAEPINTATGDYYSEQTDLAIAGRGLPFVFNRYYNSLDTVSGPLGIGWTHSYNLFLWGDATTGQIHIRQQDGSVISFQPVSGGGYAPATPGDFDRLTQNADGSFTLLRPNQTRLTFLASGFLSAVADRNGNTQSLTYSAAGDLVSITDTVGRTVTLAYDGNDHLVSVTDWSGRTVSYAYDGANHLISATDPAGDVTAYAYDASDRLLTGTDARGVVYVRNTYDANGRVIAQMNGRGIATQLAYNTPVAGTTTITDGNGNTVQHGYDASNRLIQVIDGTGARTSYTYDANNDRTSVTDANGHVTTYTYDGSGNVLTVTNALGQTSTSTYDPMNDLTSFKDQAGGLATLRYDAAGNLIGGVDALGNATAFTRDAYGELTALIDALGETTQYAYDGFGDLVSVTDGAGRKWTYGYDVLSRRVSITDPLGNLAQTRYDVLDRVTERIDALSNASQTTYDPVGNLLTVTDANGNQTSYTYDANSKLVELIDAAGARTLYTYDANNNLASTTNARGFTTTYAYDAANRLLSTTDPLKRVHSVTYDPVGGVTSSTDGNSATTVLAYDPLERLTSTRYADGSTAAFGYNATGDLVSVTDLLGTSLYGFDAVHELTSQSRTPAPAGSGQVSYGYDAVGRRIALGVSPGQSIAWQYDASGRMTGLSDWLGHTTTYAYDSAGRLSTIDYPNGVTTRYGLDADGRPTSILAATARSTVANFGYTYDAVGNVLSKSSPLGLSSYGYDKVYRLASEVDPIDGSVTYTYDADGNRTSAAGNSGKRSYTYDAADELVSAGEARFTYDGNGALTARTGDDSSVVYTWNAARRLTAVKRGGVQTQYTYDGLGRRIGAVTPEAVFGYLYDETQDLPELLMQSLQKPGQSRPGPLDVYLDGIGVAELLRLNAQSFAAVAEHYLHQDALGSTVAVTGPTARVSARIFYGTWGQSFETEIGSPLLGREEVPFKFTGQLADPADGLVNMRARYYDPTVGRFISPDPRTPSLGDAWDRNPYLYARGNPATFIDPSGLSATPATAVPAATSGTATSSVTAAYATASVATCTGGNGVPSPCSATGVSGSTSAPAAASAPVPAAQVLSSGPPGLPSCAACIVTRPKK